MGVRWPLSAVLLLNVQFLSISFTIDSFTEAIFPAKHKARKRAAYRRDETPTLSSMFAHELPGVFTIGARDAMARDPLRAYCTCTKQHLAKGSVISGHLLAFQCYSVARTC